MSLAQLGQRESQKTDYRSLTWYLACRAAVITFLLGGAAIFYLRGNVETSAVVPLLLLIGVSYAQALGSALLLRFINKLNLFAQVQIVWDLLFVTALILLTGGVESVFSFAYLLVIVSASFLLSRRQTVFAAASAAILFGGILDLQYFNYLHQLKLYSGVSADTFLSSVFVHVVAFLLTSFLSGTLADRWRRTEAELVRQKIDFAELEKMNQTILAHINSGLMMLSSEGMIRSFNRAASEVTGYPLEEVYGRAVTEVFPGLQLFQNGKLALYHRAEGLFVNKDDERIILGYSTTVARGRYGEEIGMLVTFQDLTQLKKIEAELQRADRLAAVGRLASGMAHEIRNPLASISGSVQLLMEAEHINRDDHRLMGIVVKEAERLSGLLTDFLTFARPPIPRKEKINVGAVLDELVDMLAADKRFADVVIKKNYPEKVTILLDRGQIWQVLWDLAINATEAMEGRGELHFSADAELATIGVEDTGIGISEEIKNRIFDPFFSTKEKGTGLGLASVYSVVEAHGGKIEVDASELGGARFVLNFTASEG